MLALTLVISVIVNINTSIIDGYTNLLSAFPGDSVALYLNASNKNESFNVRLFDLNGKAVANFKMPVFSQNTINSKSYENGYDYKITSKIAVPDLKSGVYLWENKIPFVIKTLNAKIVILYPSNTINAYCNSGGKSFYEYNSNGNIRATKVSFLRPMSLPNHAEDFLRWIQKQQYTDVGYITDLDLENYRSLKKSSLLIVPGHSEYWTLRARKNFDKFVKKGNDVMVLSGNTMWWQVRYNDTKDQLICYKTEEDPIKKEKLKTINWNQASLEYPITQSIGTDFSLAGYGRKTDEGWNGYKIISQSPLLEGTTLKLYDTLSLESDELDGAPLSSLFNGIPKINNQALGFKKAEIVGFDKVVRGGKEGIATWIVFKRTKSSGIVINTASTNWCSYNGIGSNPNIQTITKNMIDRLLNKENVFSPVEATLLAKADLL